MTHVQSQYTTYAVCYSLSKSTFIRVSARQTEDPRILLAEEQDSTSVATVADWRPQPHPKQARSPCRKTHTSILLSRP
jgi:hypothetical protein